MTKLTRLLLICSVLCLASPAIHAQDSFQYYEDAVSRYADKDYKSAEIQLKNALNIDSQHLPSRLLLGKVYMRQGDPFSAEKELKIALRLGAARDKIFIPLGNALLLQRKYQELLDTIATVNPGTSEAEQVYIFRGRAHLGLNQFDDAALSFERAAELAPDGLETLLGQSAVLKARNETAQAEALVDRARLLYPENHDVWYEKGVLRAMQGDTEVALESYNHILKSDPLSYKALAVRGGLYLRQGDTAAALQDLQLVHENVSSDFNSAFLYASALSQEGRGREAQAVIAKLAELFSRIPESVLRKEPGLLRAVTLLNFLKGDFEQASTYGGLYLTMQPRDLEIGKLVGSIYLKLGEVDTAIELLYRVYRQRPDDIELLLLLGEAHLEKNQFGEATRFLERAAVLAPDSALVGTKLSLGKFGLGLPGDGESELLRSFELNSPESIGAGFILVQLQLRKKDTESALAYAQKLLSRQPKNPVLYNLLGAVYVQAQDLTAARKSYEMASRVSPGFLGAEYNLARLDIHEARYVDARARLEKLLIARPQSVLVLIALADLELALGDTESATPWLTKAVALDSSSAEPGIKLLNLYIQQGRALDALRQGEDLLRLYPSDSAVFAALAQAQIANGLEKDAVTSLRMAVMKADNNDGGKLLSLADQQVKLEDYTGARKTLVNAGASDKRAEVQAAIIRLELLTGNTENAEAGLAVLESLSSNKAVTTLFLGDIRIRQRRYKEALAAYRQSFELSPGTLSAQGVFTAQFLLGHRDAAQNWLSNWCLAHPDDVLSRRKLSRSLLSTGKREKSRVGYEQLIEGGHGTAEDYSYLARIYQLDKDERALELARHAYELNPNSAKILDVYGWIYVTEGDLVKGLPLLREAVSRDSDPYLRYHLAMALNEAGRIDEARLELQAILRTNKQYPWKENAQNLYDSLPAGN